MSKNKRPTIKEIPRKEIDDLIAKGVQNVRIRILRRAPNGTIQTITPGADIETVDMINGTLERNLDTFAGGGTHTVETMDTMTYEEILPRFQLNFGSRPRDTKTCTDGDLHLYFGSSHMPGPSHPAASGFGFGQQPPQQPLQRAPQAPGAFQQFGPVQVPSTAFRTPGVATPRYTAPGQLDLPPADQLPGWARSYPAATQWAAYYEAMQQQGRLPEGASVHSDQLAQQHASTWQTQWSGERAENAKLRAELEQIRRENQERDRKYQEELRKIEKERSEEKHRLELERLRSEIQMVKDGGTAKTGPDWGSLSAAFAPVLATLIESRTSVQKIESDRTLESMKIEKSQHAEMVKAMHDKPGLGDQIVPLITAAVPILQAWMSNNSPGSRAEIMDVQHQSQMMQLKMVSDMILAHAENQPEPPTWLPLVQGVLEGIQKLGQGALQQMSVHQAPPRQLPPAPDGTPTAEQKHPVVEDENAVWARLAETDEQAARMTQMVWENIPAAAGFHTHEWRILIFNIHCRSYPEQIAPTMVDHLEHCERYNLMPEPLVSVFDTPREAITPIIEGLPIGSADPDYASRLVDTLVAEVESRLDSDEDETPEKASTDDADDSDNARSTIDVEGAAS